jgi:hypothetical protein
MKYWLRRCARGVLIPLCSFGDYISWHLLRNNNAGDKTYLALSAVICIIVSFIALGLTCNFLLSLAERASGRVSQPTLNSTMLSGRAALDMRIVLHDDSLSAIRTFAQSVIAMMQSTLVLTRNLLEFLIRWPTLGICMTVLIGCVFSIVDAQAAT